MDIITIFGVAALYILILLIQIIQLIITAKKNDASKWKKLFVFEAVSFVVALILCGVFWMIMTDSKDFWEICEDIIMYLWSFYASVGAAIVYGVMLVIIFIVKVIRNKM